MASFNGVTRNFQTVIIFNPTKEEVLAEDVVGDEEMNEGPHEGENVVYAAKKVSYLVSPIHVLL